MYEKYSYSQDLLPTPESTKQKDKNDRPLPQDLQGLNECNET